MATDNQLLLIARLMTRAENRGSLTITEGPSITALTNRGVPVGPNGEVAELKMAIGIGMADAVYDGNRRVLRILVRAEREELLAQVSTEIADLPVRRTRAEAQHAEITGYDIPNRA